MELELGRLSEVETPLHGNLQLTDDADGSLAADGVRFPQPFRIDGSARMERRHVVVAGRVTGSVELECGRCLARMPFPVDVEFEARHAEASAAPKPAAAAGRSVAGRGGKAPAGRGAAGVPGWTDDDDGIELARTDLDVSYLEPGATSLRVEDVVCEQVLLELPLRPLCRPDCAGLCPRCGANRNESPCGCPDEDEVDVRLAGLGEWKKRLEGGSGPTEPN